MTRLFVDAREIPFPGGGICSLDQVLKHVEMTELAPDTVIRQVHVDGTPIASDTGGDSATPIPMSVNEQNRIEVFTASLGEIARDSIAEAVSYLGRVETVIPSLSSGFQTFPGPEAFENLRQLCEGFYWLNLLLDRLVKTFSRKPECMVLQGASITDHNQRLASILRQMVEAQEREDHILISDLLEYEILPFIPVWKEMFNAVALTSPVS